MKTYLTHFSSALLGGILLGLTCAGPTCRADLSVTISGNPNSDGWNYEGKSGSTNFNFSSTSNQTYNVDIYSAAFTLSSGSPLISSVGGYNWTANDLVVGVGGIFDGSNPSLLYNAMPSGATSTRIVVKYGSPSASWAPGNASLQSGGVGSVLLGTASGYFFPADSGSLLAPLNSPTEQISATGTATISGDVGRVVTYWSGSTMVGFESFLDLTLLSARYSSADVVLGDKFILDMQDNTAEYQDSDGVLPNAVLSPVPEPRTYWLLGALAAAVIFRRRRSAERRLVD